MIHRVLITGGSGFLGRRCIPLLLENGYDVVALARSSAAAEIVESLGGRALIGDLDDVESLKAVFHDAEADALLNLASLGFGHAAAIVEACEASGPKRAVFVSTTAIFTRLNAPSKMIRVAAEHAVESSALHYTIIRPTMIYGGADDRNISRLCKLVRRSPVVPMPGGGRRLQQPVHVEDVAAALVSCLGHPETIGLALNIAGPSALSFKDLIRQVAESQGASVVAVPLPLSPIITAVRWYERLGKRPRFKAEQFERLDEDKEFDISEAQRLLGYSPRSFAAGLSGESAVESPEQRLTRSQGLARYARTVSHLSVRQLIARVRLRTQRGMIRNAPSITQRIMGRRVAPSGTPGWPQHFEPLDRARFSDRAVAQELLAGRFTLLRRSEDRSGGAMWTRTDLPQLWRFHAHYWDWGWHLTTLGDRGTLGIEEIWRDWQRSSKFGRMDAWSPYVVSLRLWTLCGLHAHLDARPDLQDDIATAVAVHAAYLRSNVETDVGGNHLIKNLKALLGAGVFLGDQRLARWSMNRLQRELSTQILADGGHFELSPSYHGQVLGDLIDVIGLVNCAGHSAGAHEVGRTIDAMRSWLAQFVGPDGSTPVLNDGVALDERELTLLEVSAPNPSQRLVHLRQSGYAIARPRPDVLAIFDVGDPGPDTLPAHSQADCLSLVVGTTQGWIVVDTGTSEYGAGDRRQFERSTAAHSTVEVDETDQTEVWGAFRAGRRARATVLSAHDDGESITLIAQHDGYRELDGQPVHRRSLILRSDEFDITDEVLGTGHHMVRSRLQLAAGSVHRNGDSSIVWNNGRSEITVHGDEMRIDPCEYSTTFGRRTRGHALVQERNELLPVEIIWKVSI